MKKTGILIGLLFLFTLLIHSCTSANKEELIPAQSVCDTTNVTYTNDVVPILSTYCYSCHGDETYASQSGYHLQDYNTLKLYALNGQLYGNITHITVNPMPPPPAPKLDSCQILTIKAWIDSGALDN